MLGVMQHAGATIIKPRFLSVASIIGAREGEKNLGVLVCMVNIEIQKKIKKY
jgi:hypothetical protein